MKKIIVVLCFISSLAIANAQSFDGVPIDGLLKTCVTKYQAKGYKLKSYYESGAIMTGRINSDAIELNIVKTPKSGIVWKVVVSFPERTSWDFLHNDYETYFSIIKNKYGHPETSYSYFKSPYELGDGYEMTAVRVDKCKYIAFWDATEMSIFLEITKWAQVTMHYESTKNVEIKRREEEQINSSKF